MSHPLLLPLPPCSSSSSSTGTPQLLLLLLLLLAVLLALLALLLLLLPLLLPLLLHLGRCLAAPRPKVARLAVAEAPVALTSAAAPAHAVLRIYTLAGIP
jgi:hypothetical protein